MSLTFQPKPGAILICNFSGYIEPEIVKRRPVVVIKAHKRNSRLVAVVPLSTTAPTVIEAHHYCLRHNPIPGQTREAWAKCDLVAVVSTERLDLIRSHRRRPDGKRNYLSLQIEPEQFDAIRRGVMAGLGLPGTVAA